MDALSYFAMLGLTGLPGGWQLKNPQTRRRQFWGGGFRFLILILIVILIEMEKED
jgi:hypothetical protein